MLDDAMQIRPQCRIGNVPDAIACAFAVYPHYRAIGREVIQLELAQLADTHSGGDHQPDDGSKDMLAVIGPLNLRVARRQQERRFAPR